MSCAIPARSNRHVDRLTHPRVLKRLRVHVEVNKKLMYGAFALVGGEAEASLHEASGCRPRAVSRSSAPRRSAARSRGLRGLREGGRRHGRASRACPSKWGCVSARCARPWVRETNMNGPVPTGCQGDASVAVLLDGGGADHQRLAIALQPLPQPLVVGWRSRVTRTVIGSRTSTALIHLV